MEQEDIIALTQDVRSFKDVLSRLRKVYQKDCESVDIIKVTSHERLSDVLKILRHILEKYPAIQSNELVKAASNLIETVKSLNQPTNSTSASTDRNDAGGGGGGHGSGSNTGQGCQIDLLLSVINIFIYISNIMCK